MNPSAYPRQVDSTTCGIAAVAVLAARCDADPGYLGSSAAHIARTQKSLHALSARIGLPWPQALGTSPWSLARLAGAATRSRYRIRLATKRLRPRVDASLEAGADVLVYTGGTGSAWTALIPRHVVLLLADRSRPADGVYAVFEPSSGRILDVGADDFYAGADAALPALGHWHNVLMGVLPDAGPVPLERADRPGRRVQSRGQARRIRDSNAPRASTDAAPCVRTSE